MTNIAMYKASGKIVRGLIHRIVYKCLPLFRWWGHVPGHRDVAVSLLQKGRWIAVIPGGGEEAIEGHENAYTLRWVSSSGRPRHGWAKVVQAANVRVVPIAGINTQEMAFNIFAFLVNSLKISKLYNYLVALPGILGWFFFQLQSYSWFLVCTFLSVPVPVKAGMRIGEPMQMEKDETPEAFAKRFEQSFQTLINDTNPGGLNYTRAVKQRID